MSLSAAQLAEIRAELSSKDRYRRANAAIQLGQLGDRQSVDQLRELTDDTDQMVAIAAMYGCWQLGVDVVAIDRMVAALSSGDEELVQESVFALCQMGEAVVPKLAQLLIEQPAHAGNILRVLADIGGEVSRKTIRDFETGDPDLVDTIQELLDDWDDEDSIT